MSQYFARTALAEQMARQLIHPDVLSEGLRSGLFIAGQRRTGKTTFLVQDLIPALEREGALVIYVDLWSDTTINPARLVRDAIRSTLEQLQNPGSALLARLKQIAGAEIGVMGFKLGLKLDKIGDADGETLAQVMTKVIDQVKCDVVLIIDEVQQAITTDDGNQLLLALKAARDAVNPRPGTPGHFIVIGTGSHRAGVNELTTRRNQAFVGATSIPYPVLDADYVDFLLDRLMAAGATNVPSQDIAIDAFRTLGNRPEEMIKALRHTELHTQASSSADQTLPVIASTLRLAAADVELTKVEQLGLLGVAVFERIAGFDGDATGIFSAEAAKEYSKTVGRTVTVDEIQPVVNDLVAANLIMRRGHGMYAIADPFVQATWREKRRLLA